MPQEPPPNPEPHTISYRDNVPAAKIAKSGLARAALWCAILCASMVFSLGTGNTTDDALLVQTILAGILTVIPIALGIAGARDVHRRRVRGVWSCTIAILLSLSCIPVAVHLTRRPTRDLAYSVACKAHLRDVGLALKAYITSYGQWPDTLDDLQRAPGSGVTPFDLICPADPGWSSGSMPRSPTYTYIRPPGLKPVPPVIVVAEPPLHRDGTLMNVLYSDGAVGCITTSPAAIQPK